MQETTILYSQVNHGSSITSRTCSGMPLQTKYLIVRELAKDRTLRLVGVALAAEDGEHAAGAHLLDLCMQRPSNHTSSKLTTIISQYGLLYVSCIQSLIAGVTAVRAICAASESLHGWQPIVHPASCTPSLHVKGSRPVHGDLRRLTLNK